MVIPNLLKERELTFSGSGVDRDLYLHLGYFNVWFSQVELGLTAIMALVSGADDLEAFHILTKGMDARIKIERLRKVAKSRNPIKKDSNFDIRLKHYENLVKIRNKLSHNSFANSEEGEPRLFLSNINQLAFEALGQVRPFGEKPEELRFIDLFEHGLWMNFFTTDLVQLIRRKPHGTELEIENPRSWVPKDNPDSHQK
jgi:hypothetical protein